MTTAFFIIILILLILLSGLLSASETSLFSLPSFTLHTYQESSDPKKQRVSKLLANPRELLVTILMLNIIVNILIQNVVSSIFGDRVGWFIKVGVPFGLILLFGEIIPKSIALPNNKEISLCVSSYISFFKKIFSPIRVVLTKVASFCTRLLFFFLKKEKPLSYEELFHIVAESKEGGILDTEETSLLSGYLELLDSTVKEKMRPKEEILFYNIEEPIENLLSLFVEKECSKVPVCRGDLQNILGIFSLSEYFFHKKVILTPSMIPPYLLKPFFVPESTNAWTCLSQMREKERNLALVVDEYGSIIGLITEEDLLESVVGEIADKRDEKILFTKLSKQMIIANGKMELDEFYDLFGSRLTTETNVATISGYLIEKMEKIPQAGDKIDSEGFHFSILSATPSRVNRIYIKRLKPKKGKKDR